jgi:hypothetical protein
VGITEPTRDELRLAESYRAVLDDVCRCAQAVQDGDWQRLAAVAADLSRRAVHLGVAAGELREPESQPRVEVVLEGFARRDASPVARALHPAQSNRVTKTIMTDPFTHPGR